MLTHDNTRYRPEAETDENLRTWLCIKLFFVSLPLIHSFSSFYMIQLLILTIFISCIRVQTLGLVPRQTRWTLSGSASGSHARHHHFGGPSHSGALCDLASNTPSSTDAADRRTFKKEETPQRVLRKICEGVCPLITIHIRSATAARLSQSTDLVIIRRSED